MRICDEGRISVIIVASKDIHKGEHLCYDYQGNFGLGDLKLCQLLEKNGFSENPRDDDCGDLDDGTEEEEEREDLY